MKTIKYLNITIILFFVFSSLTYGSSHHGGLYIVGDEIVFEFGRTVKLGDKLEDALKVLEENRFSCKEISVSPEFIMACHSFMREGVYGGAQTEIRLIINDGAIERIE
jgi:hypothetical protein